MPLTRKNFMKKNGVELLLLFWFPVKGDCLKKKGTWYRKPWRNDETKNCFCLVDHEGLLSQGLQLDK